MSKNKDEVLKNRNFTVITNNPYENSKNINIRSRKLLSIDNQEENELKQHLKSIKTMIKYFLFDIFEDVDPLIDYLLRLIKNNMDQDKYWLAFLTGYYGLIEIFNDLKDNRSYEIQEPTLLIRDLLSAILSQQDSDFLADAAALILNKENDYTGDDLYVQEILSSIILNRIIDKPEIAELVLAYLEAEIKNLEKDLDPKSPSYFKLKDIIGRYHSIILDIMFNINTDVKEIDKFYIENLEKPYVSETYFKNLFESYEFQKFYNQLKKYRSKLKNRFDSFTLFFGNTEYYMVVASTLRLMLLLDELQDYFDFLLREFLTENYLRKDLEEIALMTKEYLPENDYKRIVSLIMEDEEIPLKAKAEFFELTKEYVLLLEIALSDLEYFEKYYDKLYKIYPLEIQEKLIQDYYLELPANAKTRSQYKYIIERLNDLKVDFGKNNRVDEVVEYWKSHFSRKSALKDELENAGY